MNNDLLTVTVRIMPNGEEYTLELSRFTAGKEILDALKEQGLVNEFIDDEPQEYDLYLKGNKVQIQYSATLNDLHVRNNDTIIISPIIPAG